MASKVVTRFSPSNTGALHIGGARTALFSWLYARHHGGEFKLRIEDTDKERSDPALIPAILGDLAWLGLDHDGDVVLQSANADRHREVVTGLIDRGSAYRCFLTPEEIAENRAANSGAPIRSPWRDSPVDWNRLDAPHVVRLKAPREGSTVIEDAVQGRVEVQNSELDDMVLVRSDGSPTYMLAVVVDDHDMGVTHIIRGDDHLSNAFRQVQIIRAMGWAEPTYAHIPLIHGEDGKKLSKRHGAQGVDSYRDAGIVPDAIFNYLLRLGWGHGDAEVISRDEAISWFDLSGVGRAPVRLDTKKLMSLNGEYIRAMPDEALVEAIADDLQGLCGERYKPTLKDMVNLTLAMPGMKLRATDLKGLAQSALFYLVRPEISVTDPVLRDIRAVIGLESNLSEFKFRPQDIEDRLRAYAEERDIKFKDVMAPLRLAITGSKVSPPLIEALWLLGQEEVDLRIARALLAHEERAR